MNQVCIHGEIISKPQFKTTVINGQIIQCLELYISTKMMKLESNFLLAYAFDKRVINMIMGTYNNSCSVINFITLSGLLKSDLSLKEIETKNCTNAKMYVQIEFVEIQQKTKPRVSKNIELKDNENVMNNIKELTSEQQSQEVEEKNIADNKDPFMFYGTS